MGPQADALIQFDGMLAVGTDMLLILWSRRKRSQSIKAMMVSSPAVIMQEWFESILTNPHGRICLHLG
jgi:hypothetical protein